MTTNKTELPQINLPTMASRSSAFAQSLSQLDLGNDLKQTLESLQAASEHNRAALARASATPRFTRETAGELRALFCAECRNLVRRCEVELEIDCAFGARDGSGRYRADVAAHKRRVVKFLDAMRVRLSQAERRNPFAGVGGGRAAQQVALVIKQQLDARRRSFEMRMRGKLSEIQKEWRGAAMEFWECKEQVSRGLEDVAFVWDPISHAHWNKCLVRAVQIVPCGGDLEAAGAILGDPEASFQSDPRNWLFLAGSYADAWENGHFSITQTKDTIENPDVPPEFEIILLKKNPEWLKRGIFSSEGPTWETLDHKFLKFNNDARPKRKYLYYRFVANMIATKRAQDKGLTSSKVPTAEMWTSPGKYLDESIMRRVGEVVSKDVDQWMKVTGISEHTRSDLPKKSKADQDVCAQKFVAQSFASQFAEHHYSRCLNDDSDSDFDSDSDSDEG